MSEHTTFLKWVDLADLITSSLMILICVKEILPLC